MGKQSAIEWTDATWNPWRGCQKVSPGCARCYMFREQLRYGRDPLVVVRAAPATFEAPLRWLEPQTIFTCSWSDWFHPDADRWRPEAWDIIRRTPQHRYLVLTKRPELAAARLPWVTFPPMLAGSAIASTPWPNVWLGVSVENQRWVERIGSVLGLTDRLFVSAEPLLGPLELGGYLSAAQPQSFGVRWLIAGGESGPGARPMDLEWARSLRDQCARAHVPFFLKQLGGQRDKRGGAAAILDGRRHVATPWEAA